MRISVSFNHSIDQLVLKITCKPMNKRYGFFIFFVVLSTLTLHAQVNPNETVAANIILSADLDGDGVLSNFEAKDDWFENFELIDTNNDNFIDQPEIVFYLTKKENK